MDKNKILNIGDRTYIMGILNITPDSFSDGGDNFNIDTAIERAKEMIREGADIIDVGGMSTRPGHEDISVEEEISRVLPVVQRLVSEVSALISVDTYRWQVAEKVLKAGAHIINDVWGLQYDNGEMAEVVSHYKPILVIMHNQNSKVYEKDIILSMRKFFETSFSLLSKYNYPLDKVFIDPGIGFGKGYDENLEVLRRLNEIKDIAPILLGTSRKRFIGTILGDLPPKERCEGTISTNILSISNGVEIIRVHDVLEHKRACLVADKILRK